MVCAARAARRPATRAWIALARSAANPHSPVSPRRRPLSRSVRAAWEPPTTAAAPATRPRPAVPFRVARPVRQAQGHASEPPILVAPSTAQPPARPKQAAPGTFRVGAREQPIRALTTLLLLRAPDSRDARGAY